MIDGLCELAVSSRFSRPAIKITEKATAILVPVGLYEMLSVKMVCVSALTTTIMHKFKDLS